MMVTVRLGNACATAGNGSAAAASAAKMPSTAARRFSISRSPSNPVPVRNFDHPGALRKLLDERVGCRAIVRVEIGVPFVEQIDRRAGVADDLLERPQLPLAGREAGFLGHWVAVLIGLDLVLGLRELERQPV